MTSLSVIRNSLKGELFKLGFKLKILSVKNGINRTEKRDKKLIVSLTSYGRRVNSVAPYTIMSLLRQNYKPDKIILWLDSDNWNDNNLPSNIKKLKSKGLDVRFCPDYKSYKKLIPAISEFPDDLIFTADDDIYYAPDTIEVLMQKYKENPNRIYGCRGHQWKVDNHNNQIVSYSKITRLDKNTANRFVLLTGCGGCLYQRRLLYKDIDDSSLFMKLAPNADDLWFFFMEYLQGTVIEFVPTKNKGIISMDAFYQHFHKGSSLSQFNCGQNQNDIQAHNIVKYYNINFEKTV